MNKNEFFYTLDKSLSNFSKEERSEIIYDYEEHFRIGEENGKTENELILELGEPKAIAKQYKATQTIELAQSEPSTRNIFSAVLAGISLGFFNLVIVLGPFMGIIGVVIGLFAAAIGIGVAGIGILVAAIAAPFLPELINIPINIPSFALILGGVGTLALGVLFFIGVCYLGKYLYIGTISYLKWNIKIITK